MEVCQKLVYLRGILNLSQEGLARELGVSFATINRWENEHYAPNKRYLIAIDEFAKRNGIQFDKVKDKN